MKIKQMAERLNSVPVRKKAKQLLAATLAVLMVNPVTGYGVVAHAQEAKTITTFAELSGEIVYQQLAVGAEESDIHLPDTLNVTIGISSVDTEEIITKEAQPDETAAEESATSENNAEEAQADKSTVEEPQTEENNAVEPQPDETPAEDSTVSENDAEEPQDEAGDTEEATSTESNVTPVVDSGEALSAQSATESAISADADQTDTEEITLEERTLTGITWQINTESSDFDTLDSANAGAVFFYEPVLPEGYTLADGVSLPQIKVQIEDSGKWAFSQSKTIDGIEITVKAEKGVFPEGAVIHAEKVTNAEDKVKIEDAVTKEVKAEDTAKTVEKLVSFDITITDTDGNELQPDTGKGEVKVSFAQLPMVTEDSTPTQELKVFHMDDSLNEAEGLDTTVNHEAGTLEAPAEHFTVYTAAILRSSAPDSYIFDISEGSIAIQKGTNSGTFKVLYAIKNDGYHQTYDPTPEVSYQTKDNIPQDTKITVTGETTEFYYGLTVDTGSGQAVNLELKDCKINHSGFTGGARSPIELVDGSSVKLILTGENAAESGWCYAGIYVPKGATLTVCSESGGKLVARSQFGGAGIGGSSQPSRSDCGSIIINSGEITAYAYAGGAAIGSGVYSTGSTGSEMGKHGSIVINGGTVKATTFGRNNIYGSNSVYAGMAGAGIGGCFNGCVDSIKITVGEVTATGYFGAAGIGSGFNGATDGSSLSCGDIQISGGTISAEGGGSGAAAIGAGAQVDPAAKPTGEVTVTGGTLNLNGGEIKPIKSGLEKVLSVVIHGEKVAELTDFTATVTLSDGTDTLSFQGISFQEENGVKLSIQNYKVYSNIQSVKEVKIAFEKDGVTFQSVDGEVTDNGSSVTVALGTEISKRSLSLTIHDGRIGALTESSYQAKLELTDSEGGSKTYDNITLSKENVTKLTLNYNLYACLKDIQKVKVTLKEHSDYSWESTNPLTTLNDISVVVGEPLYRTILCFYDGAITGDVPVNSLSFEKSGSVLQNGKDYYVPEMKIVKKQEGYGELVCYLPEENAMTIKAQADGINGGNLITAEGKQITPTDGKCIMVLDNNVKAPLTEAIDLSYGNIRFEKDGIKLKITYYDASGRHIATGQNFSSEYNIIQTGYESTQTGYSIYVESGMDQELKINLAGINTNVTGNNIDIINSKVFLKLTEKNTVDCGGGQDSSNAGIRVPSGSELTIDGKGSLEVKNPSKYGAGIGGQMYEGCGKITIMGGSIKTTGRDGSGIGSGWGYNGSDVGSITVTGGELNAISEDCGYAIGGGLKSNPAKVVITGGAVSAITSEKYGVYNGAIGGDKGTAVVEISGGRVEAKSFSSSMYSVPAVGSSKNGKAEIKITGGTVLVEQKYNKKTGVSHIGAGSGSVVITGGTICTTAGGKPVISVPVTNGKDNAYYTTANVEKIYGKNQVVNNAKIEKSAVIDDYGFEDVTTDQNGMLHLYLPANSGSEETKAVFCGKYYAGSIFAANEVNTLTLEVPLTIGSDVQLTATEAHIPAKSEENNTIYYVLSNTPLGNGSEVENAVGVRSVSAGNDEITLSFTNLNENTDYICYIAVKTASGDYSSVKKVEFTTLLSEPASSDVSIDYLGEKLKAKQGLSYMLEYALSEQANPADWHEITQVGTDISSVIGGNPKTLYIRKKTGGNASTAITTVLPARPTVEQPQAAAKTDTSITLKAVSGARYKLVKQGGTMVTSVVWQDSNVFEKLSPNTAYTFVQQIKAKEATLLTDGTFASAESPEVSFTTEKAEITGVSVTAYNGVYDCVSHELVAVVGNPTGTDITYSANGGQYQSKIPKAADKGSYPIKVKISGTDYKELILEASAQIGAKEITSSDIIVMPPDNIYYTGGEIQTQPTVHDGSRVLTENDYMLSYENNINAADSQDINAPALIITGKGNYKGALRKPFTINKAPAPVITYPTAGRLTYGQKLSESELKGGSTQYGIFAWEAGNNVPTVKNNGYRVTFLPNANTVKNYEAITNITGTVNVTVGKKEMTVKANDQLNVIKGAAMPELTYIVTGLVGSDTFTGPTVSATATDTGTVGEYDIIISGGTLANADSYAVSYESGRLTVVNAVYPVTVTNGTGGGSYSEGQIVTITADSRSGYTFTGWSSSDGVTFASSTASMTNFTMPGKAVTITANYSKNSSGDSSGSSGVESSSGSSSTTTTVQGKKPNQPVTASALVTATAGKNGTAIAYIPEKSVTDTIAKAQADAKAQGKTANGISVELNVTMPKGATSLIVTLTRSSLDSLVNAGVRGLKINGSLVSVSFDKKALTEIQKQSTGNISITIAPKTNLSDAAKRMIGTRPVYDITVGYGSGKSVSSFGGGIATVSIPYTLGKNETIGGVYAVYVDTKGNATRIAGSAYDANSGCVIFTTTHFSQYGIGYTAPASKFTDISSHWGKESIDYVVGRGLLAGTSDTAFSPNSAMTRGMLVTALGRLAGVDTKVYTGGSFTDVKSDSAYRPYIEWAYQKGIIQGIGNNQFAPDWAVTRQEIAGIFANYAKATGYILPVTREATTYADTINIGSSCKDAVKAMQQAGIMMGGSDNKFNPKGNATRAEVSSMLHRYIKLTINPATAQGWALNDGRQYLYYKDGKALTDTQTIDGVKYFFNTDGMLKTGWVKDGDNWRYYSGKTMLVGFLDIGANGSNKTYYFTKDGLMVTGKWLEIDGKWYYFYADGSLARSTKIHGYEVDENGVRKAK